MSRLFAPRKAATPTPPADPTPPPVATGAVTKEELKAMLDGALTGVGQQLAGALGELKTELASRAPQVVVTGQPPATAAVIPITDDEIDTAIASGQGVAARVRALIDRAVTTAADRLLKEHIEPMRQFGVSTLADLSHRVTASGMPYYTKYKKEIDERLNALSPELRANPEAIQMIHDAVVGRHATEIEAAAAEAAVRKAQEGPGGPAPGTGAAPAATRDKKDEIPSLVDVGGQDAIEALKHKGRGNMDQDALAQSMGYADWATYQRQYQELLAAETKGEA